jgi:hypothetical protein
MTKDSIPRSLRNRLLPVRNFHLNRSNFGKDIAPLWGQPEHIIAMLNSPGLN